MKNSFDPFQYVNFRTVSAVFFGTLLATWVVSQLLTYGLFFIGLALLRTGEWYAREIYRLPAPDVHKIVVLGWLITGAGISLAHAWIILTNAPAGLHLLVWLWSVMLTGGPMVYWQRLKKEEQRRSSAATIARLSIELPNKRS